MTTLLLLASGCGYAFTHTADGPRRKVAVQVVDNRTFRQRIEIPLTRRLLEQLPVLGPSVPATREDADVELAVEIVDIQGQTLAGAGRTPVREGALDFAVRVRLTDLASGKLLRERKLIDRAEFRVAVGETEASATEEAAYDLARKIVLALDEDF
ncbi:MAG: LPS assembly lipoprotein LptE [Planctomycetota bacterium]